MGVKEKWGNLPPFKGNLDEKLENLKQNLSSHPKILGAYIFGSRASNKHREESDIDIALLTKKLSAEELTTLFSTITHVLGTDRIDIVLLNDASPSLKFNIIREGHPFYFRSDDIENQFEMHTMKEYWDTQYLRSKQFKLLEEEMRDWSLKGRK